VALSFLQIKIHRKKHREHARGTSDLERAVAVYYAMRDGFRYAPYRLDLSHHGSFNDLPLGRLIDDFAKHYPGMGYKASALQDADFDADVSREVQPGLTPRG